MLHYLGTSSEDTLCRVGSPRAQKNTQLLPINPQVPFSALIPHEKPLAIDLLSRMLNFDPAKRVTCEEVLNHLYLQI